MNILAIETSCDETAAAVVENGTRVHSSVIHSQIEEHRPYSGVVPEVASRAHATVVNRVVAAALAQARAYFPSTPSLRGRRIDAIAVTVGPGLVGSLLVGRMTAEALGWAHGVPTISVNHIEGHLLSPLLYDRSVAPPFMGLVVSGGHTELIVAHGWSDYALLGRTRDDAAGEAFDKVGKMMGLDYPGGPAVDRLARRGRTEKAPFPRPWLPGTWDFSFSGLKTAMLYRLREKPRWTQSQKADLCAGFQEAVVDVLVGKTIAAARALKLRRVVVGGGVAANSRLRARLTDACAAERMTLIIAPPALCTDNAAMIGCAAYFKTKRRAKNDLSIQPQLHIASVVRGPLAPKDSFS